MRHQDVKRSVHDHRRLSYLVLLMNGQDFTFRSVQEYANIRNTAGLWVNAPSRIKPLIFRSLERVFAVSVPPDQVVQALDLRQRPIPRHAALEAAPVVGA